MDNKYYNEEQDEEMQNSIKTSNSSLDVKIKDIVNLLKNIYDPEIHFSIYHIGLIYEIHITNEDIFILMTLTSPNCPEAVTIPDNVYSIISEAYPEKKTRVEVTFNPPWTIDNMTEDTKLGLGLL